MGFLPRIGIIHTDAESMSKTYPLRGRAARKRTGKEKKTKDRKMRKTNFREPTRNRKK